MAFLQNLTALLGDLTLDRADNVITGAVMAPGLIVRLRNHCGGYLNLNNDQIGQGGVGSYTHFRLSSAPNHGIRLESIMHPGKFVGIDADKDIAAVGAGGAGCHFKVHVKGPGKIALSRLDGKGGFIGCHPNGEPKPPSKCNGGPGGHFIVEAILDPRTIGMMANDEIRLHRVHAGHNGFVRINSDGTVDANGGDGLLPFFTVGDAQGNITLKSAKTGHFLAHTADLRAVAGPQPGYFSFFFAPFDKTVAIMANAPPRRVCLSFNAAGQPIAPEQATGQDAIYYLHGCIDPALHGIHLGMTQFRLKCPSGRYLRIADGGVVDFEGGDGPAPWFIMHPHSSAHGRFAMMSAHFKTCLRFNGAGGFDGKAQPTGPNAAVRLYSLGENRVAVHTPGGFIKLDGTLEQRPNNAACFHLELR